MKAHFWTVKFNTIEINVQELKVREKEKGIGTCAEGIFQTFKFSFRESTENQKLWMEHWLISEMNFIPA